MPRFGRDRDSARKEELDRQAAEEVERLTRRGGPPGAMPNTGQVGMMSPLERIAAEAREAPPPSQRPRQAPRRPVPAQPQAFTPLPSGSVGSSFGPGGLNPGPRMAGAAPPPPAFGGGAYDEDYGGHVVGPPVYNAGEYDEEEEMSITEMALMDHAARTGHNPEDLVMHYDASSAEEMRDAAMRQFYARQAARQPTGIQTNNPFAPAGMRRGPAGPAGGVGRRNDDPAAAGGALAQRLANKRRREEEQARRATAPAEPDEPRTATARSTAVTEDDRGGAEEGALARVLARRRQSLGTDRPSEPAEAPASQPPGRRHAEHREETSPGMRAIPLRPELDDDVPSLEDMAAAVPTRAPAKKAPAARRAAAAKPAAAAKAPVTTKASAQAKKGTKAAPAAKKAPAKKAPAAAAAASGAKAVFCMECGEKNPAIAKFCFNCGTRLAAQGG